jgi:Phage integrase family.
MRDDIYLIRDFVEHGEEINAIKEGVSDSIRIPELSGGDGICDEFLKPERAEEIRGYLRKYKYASRDHAVWVIWLETGRRISCLRSLDIEDFGYNEDHGPYLHFRHRPETELKNDKQSEEKIYVGESAAEVIEDYCSESRIDVLNENGREPLLTTNRGRISSTTLRKTAYNYTRTCVVGSECPHGRDPEDCAAKQNLDKASKCPSSRSPHAVRSGFATTCRRRGITPVELSNRFDASPEVIKKHYEKTTTDERAKARKPRFDEVRDDGGGFL